MLPEIPGAITLARSSGGGVFVRGNHGAGLQAVPVFVLDGVLLVIEDGTQAFVQMRDVVAAVEVVIDEHFPVAVDVVGAAVEVMEFADAERGHAFDQPAEKFGERDRLVVEVDEDEALPGFDPNGDQAILCAVEILHAFELGHAFQGTVEAVVPSVIGTMQQSMPCRRAGLLPRRRGGGKRCRKRVECRRCRGRRRWARQRPWWPQTLPAISVDRCARPIARFC